MNRDSPTTLNNSHLGTTDQGLSTPTPFCKVRPRPSLRPAPRSWLLLPSKRFQKSLKGGAFLLPGRVTPRIRQSGEDAPPPPPFSLSTTREGRFGRELFEREFWAGGLGGRYLGGSFGREMFLCALVAATPAPSIRPVEIVTARCALRMASCEDGGGVVVEGGVVV